MDTTRSIAKRALLYASVGGIWSIGWACTEGATETVLRDALQVTFGRTHVTICEGQSDVLSAQVVGGSRQEERGVRFTSRNTTVVTIREQHGAEAILEAKNQGTTTIVAAALAEPAVRDSIEVYVDPCTTPTPTIAIVRITLPGTSTVVDPSNVAGVVDVHLTIDSAPLGAVVRVLVDNEIEIDCMPLDAASSVIHCTLDTTVVNSDGVSLVANGSHDLTAQLIRLNGVVVASNQRTIVVNNSRV